MTFDRAAGGRQRDRDIDGPLLGDVNVANHPELHDVAVQLGVDDDLQRLEDLISRGHATYCRRTAQAAARGCRRAPAASRASIAQRRASSHSGSSPSVTAISRGPTPCASIPRIGRSASSRRSPIARSARLSSSVSAPSRSASSSSPRRGGLGQHALGAGDHGAHGQAAVGERGVDDHPRRRRQAAGAQAEREAVVVGQVEVHQRDLRPRVGDRLEALARGGRRGGDAQTVLVLDQPAQPGTNGGVIVDEHDVHHDRVAAGARRSHPVHPPIGRVEPYGSTRPRRIA